VNFHSVVCSSGVVVIVIIIIIILYGRGFIYLVKKDEIT
jgi:hypothetical protein